MNNTHKDKKTSVKDRSQENVSGLSEMDDSVEVYMQLLQETSSTERSLMSVLPGLTEGCTSVDFRELLYRFKDQIAGQADRLEEMLDDLGDHDSGIACLSFELLTAQIIDILDDHRGGRVEDAQLLTWLRRAIHFQIASYRSLLLNAEKLTSEKYRRFLQLTLSEKQEFDTELELIETQNADSKIS
ncbi:ferritin-like metal-binding protein YciE [Sphingobacterium allocomposti]|uniref:Ferritin-like metal-binding protein YciE n=1 Tax=Sphingobacterium allocomposti TaxID=415956 RepID=A0A5S5DII4_9SPHI|nr:DUF892 family protein [Sphingobacterium composti Yoo et al. 2007 non Ten et al. 2007]TYP95741.1 ferritin-like metal-binding protein YciE [Sphingobacterium composti Yoo et al. 2007 non Ten et al. 2007]